MNRDKIKKKSQKLLKSGEIPRGKWNGCTVMIDGFSVDIQLIVDKCNDLYKQSVISKTGNLVDNRKLTDSIIKNVRQKVSAAQQNVLGDKTDQIAQKHLKPVAKAKSPVDPSEKLEQQLKEYGLHRGPDGKHLYDENDKEVGISLKIFASAMKVSDEGVATFKRAREQYSTDSTGKLQTKQGISLNMSEKTLDLAVRVAHVTRAGEAKILFEGSILVHKDEEHPEEVSLFALPSPEAEPLMQGHFGTVAKVTDLLTGDTESTIVKQTRKDLPPSELETAKADTSYEYQLLREIHGGGKATQAGIQAPPRVAVDFTTTQTGYIAPRYEGDFVAQQDAIAELPPQKRADCARQLLQGLVTLHKLDIRHGDIKAGNCLVKQSPDKEGYEIVLADFGGARRLKDSEGQIEFEPYTEWGVCTPQYCCREDVTAPSPKGEGF